MTTNSHCALGERGLVRFEGADARAFLHSQLTCDVNGLGADASSYGAYCTPKGRVLATFLLWPTEAGYLIQVPRMLREALQKRLSMYILRANVRASDVTAEYVQYGLAGPDAPALVERIVGSAPEGAYKVVHDDGTALKLPLDRYLLVLPREHDAGASRLLASASRPEAETWWDGLDIAAGIASVLPETQEQFVPQMLNLDAIGGVSFNKGCYPGQEIVARMHYLGRLKERMFRARVVRSSMPRPGDKVYGADLGAQAAGVIANATPAGDGGYCVLAVVHLSSVAAGPVRLGATDGPDLIFESLPYALPQK